jgi:hypothetical protein
VSRRLALLLTGWALLVASPASAADAAPAAQPASGRASAEGSKTFEATFASSSLLDRPHTIAELEVGALALPTAPVSPANRGGSLPFGQTLFKGDATLNVGLHLLYRASRDFSFGAAAAFSPVPTSDSEFLSGNGTLTRTHSRSYLFLGGEARYYPLRYRWLEGWVGLVAGVQIIADRFTTAGDAVPEILGSREVTVRTEGFSFGLQAGGDYLLTDNLVLGIALRATRWLLPSESPDPRNDPACSSIGDCPTLTGTVEAFELGVTFGYRIPL